MTAVVDGISILEAELKELQKKRVDVEFRLRNMDNKEKSQHGLLGKRNRGENANQQNKRVRENTGDNNKRDNQRDSNFYKRSSTNNDRERTEKETNNKPTRLASVVTGQRSSVRDSQHTSSRTNREELKKPKLTSAIVSPNPFPVDGEKPRSSLDTSSEETKTRSRKLFGVLVGTLKSFKNEINKKTEAEQRREELEHKVQQKVKEEHETFKEEQRRAFQEQKEKELALREEIKQQQEQKELELLNLKWGNHRTELSFFLKTKTEPPIYYRPAKVDENKSAPIDQTVETKPNQDNTENKLEGEDK